MDLQKIKEAQKHLKQWQIDGWLLYDFHRRNHLAIDFLEVHSDVHLTRRFFYWIPADGDPVKIVHAIEPHVLQHCPGNTTTYVTWQSLEQRLQEVLQGKQKIAMEYSPRNMIPYVSLVDAGVVEQVRQFGVDVVSSAGFMQYFTCVLDEYQIRTHKEACRLLDATVSKAWDFIASKIKKNQPVTEYEVQQLIVSEFHANNFMSEGNPICAVNVHSSDPHFSPTARVHSPIQKGDFVLIDLWCKKNEPRAIYGDICRVGVVSDAPTEKQQKIFQIVFAAQERATNFVKERFAAKQKVQGYEVDRVCREYIQSQGYGEYFIHRTGHNIHTQDHGPGTHMDSFETYDERPIIPGTCFSIEPGIYLPGEFGVRLEYDVFVTKEGHVEVSGGIQKSVQTLL